MFFFLRSHACALFTVGIPVQCEHKRREGNLVAKFYDNYHQLGEAASSVSHGGTPSIRKLLPSIKKPYKKYPSEYRICTSVWWHVYWYWGTDNHNPYV